MGPLLPFFLMYLAGILTAFPSARNFLLPGLLPLALVVVVLYRRTFSWRPWVLLALFYGFGLLAPITSHPPNHITHHLQENQTGEVIGKITETPVVFPDRTRYTVELVSVQYTGDPLPVSGFARISSFATENAFHLGDIVRFKKIRLKLPRNFKNPGRFDFRQYLHSLGIDVTGNISKPEDMERLGSYNPHPLTVAIAHVKETMLQNIDKHLSIEEGGLLKGMVLGETQSLPDDLQEAYKITGLAHLLAVSGLNFTFLAVAIYFVLNRPVFLICAKHFPKAAKSGLTRKIMAFICLPPILFYMLLVGIKISSLRAGIMVVIFLLSVFVDRDDNLFNSFLVAAFLILLASPDAILNVSFQLSFAGVFAILYALSFYEQFPRDPISSMGEKKWTTLLFHENIIISFAATLGTLPILLFTFNRISLIGIIPNLLMVPLSTILMPFGLFVLTLGLISQDLANIFLPLCSLLLKIFIFVPTWFAAIPYAAIYVPTPPKLWLVLYYFVLLGVPYWIDKNRRAVSLGDKTWNKPLCVGLGVASFWVLVWFIWPRFPQSPSETLTVCTLDVGQGDATFIEFPNHKTLLIDGGGLFKNSPDIGKTVIAPFLWNQGIRQIDYLVATHSDNDHIAGLESLIKFFPVEHYLARREDIRDKRLWELRKNATNRQVKLIPFETGNPLWIGDTSITPLHPDIDYSLQDRRNLTGAAKNNFSLVLRLEYRTFSMILTGDIAEHAEQYLVDKGAPLRADFLKAPHHGSNHSSSPLFIQAVSPRAVLFSSGYLNPFHHPHPQTLDRYKKVGAEILRTDRQGTLCVVTDGMDHQIQTHEKL